MTDDIDLHATEAVYRSLPGDIQELLVCLAPFTSAANAEVLDGYQQNLQAQVVLATLPFNRWGDMLREARKCELLRPHPADPDFVVIPPAVTALLRHQQTQLRPSYMGNAIFKAFYATYRAVAPCVCDLFASGIPAQTQKAQAFMHLEYESMRTAILHAFSSRGPVIAIYEALNLYLIRAGHYQRGLELCESILPRLDRYGIIDANFGGLMPAMVMCDIAQHQQWLGQYEAASASYHKAVAICDRRAIAINPAYKLFLATIYRKLGGIAGLRRDWKPAEAYLQKCLDIRTETGKPAEQAEVLSALGLIAIHQKNWLKAMETYQKAMDLYAVAGNRLAQAKTCIDLATSASNCGRLTDAKQHYQRALAFFVEFGDRAREASVHHNLGNIAKDETRYKRAWQHYWKAIRIFHEIGDCASQAGAYNRLGTLMTETGQRRAAWLCHRRALKLASMAKDRFTEALTCRSLGNLFRRRRVWERAAAYYDRAMKIFEAFDDSRGLTATHLESWRLAYKQGRQAEGQDHLVAVLRQAIRSQDAAVREHVLKIVAWLWGKSSDDHLSAAVAQVLGVTREEAEAVLQEMPFP